jgi:hypothetical protein
MPSVVAQQSAHLNLSGPFKAARPKHFKIERRADLLMATARLSHHTLLRKSRTDRLLTTHIAARPLRAVAIAPAHGAYSSHTMYP